MPRPKKNCQTNATMSVTRSVSNKALRVCLLNSRSVCNKTLELHDFISESDHDIYAITETWLKGDMRDNVIIAELLPPGYNIVHAARGSRGGGVAIIHKNTIAVEKLPCKTSGHTFESVDCLLQLSPPLRIVVIYKHVAANSNVQLFQQFIQDWNDFLDHTLTFTGNLLVLGDFNIHMDVTANKEARAFNDTLDSYGMTQHVQQATHKDGHILDLLLTKSEAGLVAGVSVDDQCISDHYQVTCTLSLPRVLSNTRSITYRRLKQIHAPVFMNDIMNSVLNSAANNNGNTNIDDLIARYDTVLRSLIDQHAPQTSKVVPFRENCDWFNDEIRRAKQQRRKIERQWRKSGAPEDRIAFMASRSRVISLSDHAKATYYEQLTREYQHDPKRMFSVVSDLLGTTKTLVLPPNVAPDRLVDMFATFFIEKVQKIRASISTSLQVSEPVSLPIVNQLACFEPVTPDEVHRAIMRSPSKSCPLDPVPTWLLKQCCQPLLATITDIMNRSLATGSVPGAFKMARVTPLLKKPSLDPSLLGNYRPVSNLPFLSKVLERLVLLQLQRHLEENDLQELMQSAYRKGHSTETAQIRLQHDLIHTLDQKKACMLVLLDLSAAFDTVDHAQLLAVLRSSGIRGTALHWFESYLEEREQAIAIGSNISKRHRLCSGVPQGSVLGPVLFTLYTASLGQLLREHSMQYQLYADDSSIYLTFEPQNVISAANTMEHCVASVRNWMAEKGLKMNDSKTELIVISSPRLRMSTPNIPSLHIGDDLVDPHDTVKLLGVVLDRDMNMGQHINSICRSARFHLYNLLRIRRHLTKEACVQLVHGFITSKLDYCNALFVGLPQRQIQKLQRIQNMAARLVTYTSRFAHITPVLRNLHWLPVNARIEFKVILTVFKCLRGEAPAYLIELIEPYSPVRDLRSSGLTLLRPPSHPNTQSAMERDFAQCAPSLWNALPEFVRCANNVENFKKQLKTHLFTKFY